ncbi:hypothetical protein BD413DRAFT_608412 [Trametes elegans]|nr:hypothetical protein BD413DRAFT_608412 [Trametes elegans]
MIGVIPLKDSEFNLDISGVAGFFGGDVAVSAMATVHIYQGRKWLGWYNSPGSYEIAKRYGQLGRSRFWDGLYPGINVDPAVLFELDGMQGPKYKGVHSGTIITKTGHLSHLFLQECKAMPDIMINQPRRTTPIAVTVVNLHHIPQCRENPRLVRDTTTPLALIPIAASLGTCVACGVYQDWFCFSMILLGIITSGISCLVIGTGEFTFTHPQHAPGAPPGDGILDVDGGDQVVVLKGPEGAVTPITRGRFLLNFKSHPEYHNIGLSSMLLTLQFLAQLLLVPQGEIFGQVMFLCSLAVSWAYNSYLSSLDRESFQRRILMEQVLQSPRMRKFQFGTRTSMVVFVLLVLSPAEPATLRKTLDDMLPNETRVWSIWKDVIIQNVCDCGDDEKSCSGPSFGNVDGFDLRESDRKLLQVLFTDAESAFNVYHRIQTGSL